MGHCCKVPCAGTALHCAITGSMRARVVVQKRGRCRQKCKHMLQASRSSSGAEIKANGGASPGEASVKEANAARFRQTAEREFQAFRKERLATGELECQKLISAAQSHLTQARRPVTFML